MSTGNVIWTERPEMFVLQSAFGNGHFPGFLIFPFLSLLAETLHHVWQGFTDGAGRPTTEFFRE